MNELFRCLSNLKCVLLLGMLFLFAQASFAGWIEEKDGKTLIHIKVFQLPDPGDTSTYTQAELTAVNQFKKDFPEIFRKKYAEKYKANPGKYGNYNWDNVEVRLHPFSGISVQNLDSAILSIIGGMAPDVLFVNFMFSHTYIEQGFLYPLDKPEDGYMSDMTAEEIEFRINPKLWPVIKRKDEKGNTAIWTIPYGGTLGKVVAYRKDLFEEAKVPFPKNDWTWNDFMEISKKLADPARGVYAVQFGRGAYEAWWWISFLWSAGGDCMKYDEQKNEWSCVFDSPEAAVALDFYTRLCTEPWIDKNGKKQFGYAFKGEDWSKWGKGEIAMEFQYIDEKLFTRINPDVTGLVPVPIGPNGTRGAELNSTMMGLFAGIKDIPVRDAAWEYMKFYDSEKAVAIKTKAMVEGGLGKFINPRYLERFGYKEIVRYASPEWAECFATAMEYGQPEPYGKGSRVAYIMMSQPIQEVEDMALKGKLPEDGAERLKVIQDSLHKAVEKANVIMLGKVSPEERFQRRISAALLLAAIVAGMVFLILRTCKLFMPNTPSVSGKKRSLLQFGRYKWAYILLFPALVSIFFWQYIPLFRGSLMAFQDYKIMESSTWVWLDNFGDVIWSYDWWLSVWNGLRYSLLVIALTFLPPAILAIFLQEVPYGNLLFRILFYLPAVTTSLVLILLWRSFYESSESGTLNMILMNIPAIVYIILGSILFWICAMFGSRMWYFAKYAPSVVFFAVGLLLFFICFNFAEPMLSNTELPLWKRFFSTMPTAFRWLSDPSTAMLACVLPMAWAGIGPGSLIYLAALKGIPDDLYEQAEIDGANFFDKILFIVFPMLKSLLIINFVGVFIGAWMSGAGNILAMTAGSANTEVAELHIFYKAFIHGQFGPATAMAWVLSFILIGFTVQQLQILSRLEFKTTGGK